MPQALASSRTGVVRRDPALARLERKAGATWKRVRGLTLTTVRGRAVAVLGRGTYRAVVAADGNHAASTSPPVRAR